MHKWLFIAFLLAFSVGKAQKVVVDAILVEGVEKTRQQVILRELPFSLGDSLELDKLDKHAKKAQNNTYNLSLFTNVKVKHSVKGDLVAFTISVKERWYIIPQPYLSLEERTFNEWWEDKDLDRLVYGLGVYWQNFSGWNDNIFVYAQGGYSRRVTLQYSRPFLFPKARIDGSFGFRYVNNKEIGYSTRNGILQLARLNDEPMRKIYDLFGQFAKRFSAREKLFVTFQYSYFNPNDSITFFNDRYLTNASSTEYYPSIGLSYINDQRDLYSFPLDGYKYEAKFRMSGFPVGSTASFGKLQLGFAHHIPVGKRFNFSYGSQNFFLFGRKVPYFDKYFIGFGSFLRGYEPYVIDGSFINLTKAEWKFAIIPRKIVHVKQIPLRKFQDFPIGLYISGYADFGYVHDNTFNNQDNYLKDRPLLGYGIGVNFISMYDWLLRVEYSFNHLGGRGLYLSSTVSIR